MAFLQPEIYIPGIDLVEALWQHLSSRMKRVSSFSSLVKNRSWSASFRQKLDYDRRSCSSATAIIWWIELARAQVCD